MTCQLKLKQCPNIIYTLKLYKHTLGASDCQTVIYNIMKLYAFFREVLITSDALEDIPMAENSEVRFTCTTMRNPPGELTLFAESSDQIIHSEMTSTFIVPQRLIRVYNQAVFKCSVSNGGNNAIFSSHGYQYNVECKLYFRTLVCLQLFIPFIIIC